MAGLHTRVSCPRALASWATSLGGLGRSQWLACTCEPFSLLQMQYEEVPPPTERRLEHIKVGVDVAQNLLFEVLGLLEETLLVRCYVGHVPVEEAVNKVVQRRDLHFLFYRDFVELADQILAPLAAWPCACDAQEEQNPEERLHVVDRIMG